VAERAQRYTAVAIVLHWAIAFAILLMIPLGFWMHGRAEDGDISDSVFRAFQLHKSIGLTVLALSLVRLGWRLANPPPPLPEHMPGWERFVAKATHWAFYALMIGLPMSGWLYVSTGWSIHDDAALPVTTHYFGLFTVPHLFNLPNASEDVREATAEAAFTAHWVLAYAAIGLAALHVLAALKHHLFDRDEVLAHMAPGLRAPLEKEPAPKNPGRLAVLGLGLSVTGVALAAALFALFGNAAPRGPAPQEQSTIEITEPGTITPAPTAPGETPTAAAPGETATQAAPAWRVNAARSSIQFSFNIDDGSGATRIEGRFTRWRADIRFDPANLDRSSALVSIETASATTGIDAQDSALPTEPWFNASAHPVATFRATEFRRRGEGYEARGTLTIKGRGRNVDLPFTLVIDGDTAVVNGRLPIDRRAFDVGKDTEADDMVSRDVDVTIRVEATRAS
jgi:cytochrome b561/polyisoprenoid-binding protein YceI